MPYYGSFSVESLLSSDNRSDTAQLVGVECTNVGHVPTVPQQKRVFPCCFVQITPSMHYVARNNTRRNNTTAGGGGGGCGGY